MQSEWVSDLASANLLVLRDVVLDIRHERQLVGDRVSIPIFQQNVRFESLLPSLDDRDVDAYCDRRWKAVRLLESRRAVEDVDILRVSNRMESEIQLKVHDPEFSMTDRILELEAARRSTVDGEGAIAMNIADRTRQLPKSDGSRGKLSTWSAAHQDLSSDRSIFLVHGHNNAALNEVARYLEKLRQHVIILREQPDINRTIMEKFEACADVDFAVVLLTGDDRGGEAQSEGSTKLRPRQNVVFELGYFIGRLGRNRVCALYESGVELPSDYSGVLYHELDSRGSWRLELARELKAAGLSIDMNLAL